VNERRFYEGPAAADARRSAPAALRNREPIAEVLADWLPQSGLVFEVASGTGEHAAFFAERFPNLDWQPSDTYPDALASIEAWKAATGVANIKPPIVVDASSKVWPIEQADAVLNINMAHISPWAASLGLIAGAARILPEGGPLILYGPWLKDDFDTVPSNLAFDADLKARDPQWGLRRVEDFETAAAAHGFKLVEWRRMPANNLMLLFRLTRCQRT
jgi:SAM-dependent methyltransferase